MTNMKRWDGHRGFTMKKINSIGCVYLIVALAISACQSSNPSTAPADSTGGNSDVGGTNVGGTVSNDTDSGGASAGGAMDDAKDVGGAAVAESGGMADAPDVGTAGSVADDTETAGTPADNTDSGGMDAEMPPAVKVFSDTTLMCRSPRMWCLVRELAHSAAAGR